VFEQLLHTATIGSANWVVRARFTSYHLVSCSELLSSQELFGLLPAAGKEGRMPLSDHEQRMLDQIESALYAEDPKFASSVRGGTLRAPSTRRRLQGVALFVAGLAMLVAGVAFKATMIGSFPVLSVLGFVVMFGGVVFAITGPRVAGGTARPGPSTGGARQRRVKGSSGSFTSRMEDRFRRRFDE
jgi:hypothetical protein